MSNKEPGTNVNFRVPKKMLVAIDDLVAEEYYANRSEILRDALRQYLVSKKRSEDVEV